MAAACIVVNTTPQTALVVGSPPPVMRGLFADGMDQAAGHEQLATRHFEMCAVGMLDISRTVIFSLISKSHEYQSLLGGPVTVISRLSIDTREL